jgi:translation elongation factor EF-G
MSLDTTHIRASVPELIEGQVMVELNRLGGRITSVERQSDSRTAIGSTVPKKHIDTFKTWLHKFSSGQGSFAEDNI